MKLKILVYLLCLLSINTWASENKERYMSNNKFVGQWKSIEFGARDIGTHIKSMNFTFHKDGKFSLIGVTTDQGKQTFKGNYKVVFPNKFKFNITNKNEKEMLFSIQDNILTIFETKNDSWVKYKKTNKQ